MKKKKMSRRETRGFVKGLVHRLEQECPDCEVTKYYTGGVYPGVIVTYTPAPFREKITVSGEGWDIEEIIIDLNNQILRCAARIDIEDPNEPLYKVRAALNSYAKEIQDKIYE